MSVYVPLLNVDIRSANEVDIVTVEGEIDLASAPVLEEALSRLTAPQVVVDLVAVDFMDSSGLHVLSRAGSDRSRPINLVMVQSSATLRLLKLTGVNALFPHRRGLIGDELPVTQWGQRERDWASLLNTRPAW